MSEILEEMESQGWHLKESSVVALRSTPEGTNGTSFQQIIRLALDRDLTEIGQRYIQEKVSSKDGILVGPCVLQITKIRNISAPKENEHSNVAPRMLKIGLTDGSFTVNAIEYEKIDQLSLKTPPGTKVKLVGSIAISNGLLQFHPTCIKVLGGKVEKLYTKWKINYDAGGLIREGIAPEGGPPSFVAFGKRVQNVIRYKEGTKSMALNDDNNENSEFDEQRRAAIAEVSKGCGGRKTIPSDARANFGKMPDAEMDSKRTTSSHGSRQIVDMRKSDEPPKTVGIFRELSTDSGENVHQKTVNEFVVMGFNRKDVVLCLRKSNNNFEVAMDMLLELPSEKSKVGPSEDRPRNRPQRGIGRGRGRGRDRGMVEEPHSQSSNPATLFDFLQSKISINTVQDEPENSSRDRQYFLNDDNPTFCRSGEEREFRRGNGRGNSSRYNEQRGRGNTHRGRGGARNYEPRNKHRADEARTDNAENGRRQHVGEGGDGGRSNRNDYSNKDARGWNSRPQYSNNNDDWKQRANKTSEHSRDAGRMSKESDQLHHQDRQAFNKRERIQEGGRLPPRFTKSQHNGRQEAPNRANQQGRKEHNHSYRESGRPRHQNEQIPNKTQNVQEGSLPPRFTRSRPNDQHAASGRTDQHEEKSHEHTNPPEKQNFETEKAVFAQVPVNPPPAQRGPTTFGQPLPPASPKLRENAPAYHPTNYESNPYGKTRVHVALPQWCIGSECLAKYWEDSQYYRAIITDLHPTAPTAVVQFMGFGNYEEVQLFDLKPVSVNIAPTPYGNQVISVRGEPPQSMEDQHMNVRRQVKPAMALYVPPKNRGSS